MKKMVSQLTANFGAQRPSYEQNQERRNKKRKELAQSIFDTNNPFKNNNTPLNPNNNADPNGDSLSSLFSSFRLPEQLANLPKPKPWKPNAKV